MLSLTRNRSNGAHGDTEIGSHSSHCAFVTGSLEWNNDARLTLEAFSTSICDDLLSISRLTVFISRYKLTTFTINLLTSLNIIKSMHNNVKRVEEFVIVTLNFVVEGFNLSPEESLHDESSSYISLELTNIRHAEQELPVQVS